MNSFNYYHPTEIRFGTGRIDEIAETVKRYGKRCLLVTERAYQTRFQNVERVKDLLEKGGIDVAIFDGVVSNPTLESVIDGAKMARELMSEVVVGIGGGSSMDTAKAIAVGATHERPVWEYTIFEKNQASVRTLPIVTVTTTSGTGANLTQVAVFTNTVEKCKSAIVSTHIFPRATIIDPELMLTVPSHTTASTGFDVFCHAFESRLHRSTSDLVQLMAREAIANVIENLPTVVADGGNARARAKMAWADTLAGLCISAAGTILPHALAMAIGGHCPTVMHGEALAMVYPQFMKRTYSYSVAIFAELGRILDRGLMSSTDDVAAERSCSLLDVFLERVGMSLSLGKVKGAREMLRSITAHSLQFGACFDGPGNISPEDVKEVLASS